MDSINLRELLRETSDFGREQVKLLENAMSGAQVSEARQEIEALRANVDASETPSSAETMRVGIGLHLLGLHADAERYLSYVSEDPIASFHHAQVLMACGRFGESEKKFEEAGKLGYDSVECTLLRAGAIRQDGRLEDAEALLRSTASEGATRAEYSYQMGCIL